MKRCMSSNVCFNFYTDPGLYEEGNESICDYDVCIIFAECFSEDELTLKIDDAEQLVYSYISDMTLTNKEVKEEIMYILNLLYDHEPVIDVVIKKRKFPRVGFLERLFRRVLWEIRLILTK